MENRIPFFGATGFVPAPSSPSSGWSSTNIILAVLAALAVIFAIYHFFFKPSESKGLELEDKEIDPLRVMVAPEL